MQPFIIIIMYCPFVVIADALDDCQTKSVAFLGDFLSVESSLRSW